MTLQTPVTELDPRFSSSGAAAVPWNDAEAILKDAGIYWLSTVRPDGRPHVAPILALWLDGALYFCTGESEQKAKNLALNPSVIITTGQNDLNAGLDIVVEGEAVPVNDDTRLHSLAEAYVAKYGEGWRFVVHDGAFRNEERPPESSSGFDSDGADRLKKYIRVPVFQTSPRTAFGFGRGSQFSQTRWRFSTGGH